MRRINSKIYNEEPERYLLKSGNEDGAPLCPYGNKYQWIGYDLKEEEYVRFTKSIFKLLIAKIH
jgi:hypothetical protein